MRFGAIIDGWGEGCGRSACLGIASMLLLTLAGGGTARADEIAYVCGNDICTIDANNPATHADLTRTSENEDLQPVWSPDGTRIAFTGDYPPNDEGDIYVLNPAHPESAIDVSNSPTIADAVPAWSGDGTELAWESEDPSTADIHVDFAASDGTSTPGQIAATAEGGHVQDREPSWSPSGARLAFSRHTFVYLAAPNESNSAQALSDGFGVAPAWSPDGARIAVISESGDTHKVRLIDADGDGIFTELPVGAELGSTVAWSPDSSHVVYVDEDDQVRVAPTDPPGEGFTIKLPPGVIVPHRPSFSPDGSQIAFDAQNTNGGTDYMQVYLASAAGGEATQLTKAAENGYQPAWRPEVLGPVTPTGGSGGPGVPAGGGSNGTASPGSPAGAGTGGGRPGTHAPVTIEFAAYRHPLVSGGFMGAGYVDCSLGSTNAACRASGEAATYVQPAGLSRALTGHSRPKARKVVFAAGAVTVPAGQKKPLRLKLTPAGLNLLKPGRRLKVTLTVVETAPGGKPKKTTQLVTVTGPKK